MTKSASYLLIIPPKGKSLKPLKEEFKKLGGFYTGIGYAFPKKCEVILKPIIENLGLQLNSLPLSQGESFESFKLAYKADFFRQKLISTDTELRLLLHQLEVSEETEEAVNNSMGAEAQKEKALELLQVVDSLKDSIDWAEKMEKALNNTKKPLELRFISEISEDYFSKPPPDKPRLLYFLEKDRTKTTFLHKEITSMLVGEGGRGKTHLLALLGASVATGIPLFGKIEIEKPGAVCFIIGENNNGDIRRLLFQAYKHLEMMLTKNAEKKDGSHFGFHCKQPLDHFPTNFIPVSVHGMNAHFIGKGGEPTNFYNQLLEQLKSKEPEEGFQLIILDPASRFCGPEAEKDNAIATSFIASLEKLSEELKGHPTIMLSHHKSKSAIREGGGTQADARGSSGLTDGVRWQGNLNKGSSNEYSILEITKTNFTTYPNKIVMRKGGDGVPNFVMWDESQVTSDDSKKTATKDEELPSYDCSKFK